MQTDSAQNASFCLFLVSVSQLADLRYNGVWPELVILLQIKLIGGSGDEIARLAKNNYGSACQENDGADHWFFGSSKGERVSDLMLCIPSVQDLFCGIVVSHPVVVVLVDESYVWIPLFPCLGVESKVDGSDCFVRFINTVDHPTGDKSIPHCIHTVCIRETICKGRQRQAITLCIQQQVSLSCSRF